MGVLPAAKIHRLIVTETPINTVHDNKKHSRNARKMFDKMPQSDSFAWNKLIQTQLANADFPNALSTYREMLFCGVRPDRHTLPRVLSASRRSADLSLGRQLHAHALKLGCSTDRYVVAALIELYGRLDSLDTAMWAFDKSDVKDSVTWTMVARLYVIEGKPGMAVEVFSRMVDSGARIDSVALATAAGACGVLKSLVDGKKVHQVAKERGLESDVLVSNTLLKMYVDCGCVEEARAVFDQMPSKDVISWTEMIHANVKRGGFNEGIKLFREMIEDGVKPDSLAISSVLPACARMTASKQGKEIQGYLLRNGVRMNLTVLNALMDMYVKSGFIEYGSRIFGGLKHKDVVSWTVMISGCSLHGQGQLGVDLICRMEKSSIQMDEITYASILRACIAARVVEKGKFYFNCIKTPTVAHCALLVALLSRSGLFDEARNFIADRKIDGDAEVLRALLDGCRIHLELKLGKRIIEQLCDLEPLNADNYVLLSNWYAANAKWDMVDELRGMITDMGLKPRKAYSWIEFRNKVHVFGTGDVSHPRSQGIYWELQCLMQKMEDEGHRPDSEFCFHDVDEERECIPIGHSEMLAISFGLISTQAGTTVRVTKNLRVCRSCHGSAKFLSHMVGREIILKDPNCFHRFKDGYCSCGDFW